MEEKIQRTALIFGRHPVVEAIEAGQPIDKIMLQQGIRGEFEKQIRYLSKVHQIPLQYLPKERMEKLTKGNHQGIIGYLALIQYFRVEDILPTIYDKGETPLLLILDGITDVRNFGAVARSCACCGVHTIITPSKGSAQINAEAIKASAGALNNIPVCRENSLNNTIEWLQSLGVQVLASDLQSKTPLFELDLKRPTAVIMGAEDIGVSPSLLEKADERFIIPQYDRSNSFNVSVASGIVLYETLRQRGI
jgi:23S rRNA (guanosine2251-2'-O)-methyltransferase